MRVSWPDLVKEMIVTKKRRERHTPGQIVRKLRDADAMLNVGKSLEAVFQTLEVSEATYHRRRNQYGGMKSLQFFNSCGRPLISQEVNYILQILIEVTGSQHVLNLREGLIHVVCERTHLLPAFEIRRTQPVDAHFFDL